MATGSSHAAKLTRDDDAASVEIVIVDPTGHATLNGSAQGMLSSAYVPSGVEPKAPFFKVTVTFPFPDKTIPRITPSSGAPGETYCVPWTGVACAN